MAAAKLQQVIVEAEAKLKELQKPQGDEPTPAMIAMAQIQVEASKVTQQKADSAQRQQTEAFKSTLAVQQAREALQTKERIAQQSNAAQLERTRLMAVSKGKPNG